jgi:hypothetical protein
MDVVDKLGLKFWNGFYYCTVRFPDGTSQELKSAKDLTYTQWQAKVIVAWDAHQNPPPEPKPTTLDDATKEQVAAEMKERGWTAKDVGL